MDCIGAISTCCGSSATRPRGRTRGRRSSPSMPIPKRSSSASPRRSCATRTRGWSVLLPPARRSRSSSTSTIRFAPPRTGTSWRESASRVELAGFVMTPDAAFGYERQGTPEALTELGKEDGFEVTVVHSLLLDGEQVRSSEIRRRIAAGDLAAARRMLGRPLSVTGRVDEAAGPSRRGSSPVRPAGRSCRRRAAIRCWSGRRGRPARRPFAPTGPRRARWTATA